VGSTVGLTARTSSTPPRSRWMLCPWAVRVSRAFLTLFGAALTRSQRFSRSRGVFALASCFATAAAIGSSSWRGFFISSRTLSIVDHPEPTSTLIRSLDFPALIPASIKARLPTSLLSLVIEPIYTSFRRFDSGPHCSMSAVFYLLFIDFFFLSTNQAYPEAVRFVLVS